MAAGGKNDGSQCGTVREEVLKVGIATIHQQGKSDVLKKTRGTGGREKKESGGQIRPKKGNTIARKRFDGFANC